MNEQNVTRISTIQLLGFQTSGRITYLVFFSLLLVYCVTICGNLLIITLVVYSKTLHSPMYFFLSQLCVPDILLATNILPNALHTVLLSETTMSLSDCLFQLYVFGFAEAVECLLLTAMSYDRYLAICKPLHYTSIMNLQLCWVMVSICWGLSIGVILNDTTIISTLQFCGPNVIDHFFCDLDPILHLSCSDSTIAKQKLTLFGAFFLVIPFSLIIVSYIYILITILRIPSVTGKQKAFSTCSSHLIVVCTYFTTLACVYLVPSKKQSMSISKFLSLLYTTGTPLINPILYSLRNKDLKQIITNKLTTFILGHNNMSAGIHHMSKKVKCNSFYGKGMEGVEVKGD